MRASRFQLGRFARSGPPLALVVALLTACGSPGADTPSTVSAVRIPPLDVRGPVDLPDFIGRAIAESLGRQLEAVGGIQVVDAAQPDTPGTATLTGRFERGESERCLEVQARVAGREAPLWTVDRCSASASVPDLSEDVARGCLDALGREPNPLYPYIARVAGGPAMAASPLLLEARARFQRGDIDGFAETADELVAAFPDDAAAYAIRAWSATMVWDADPSEENLSVTRDKLLALDRVDPDSPYDDVLQAFVYRSSGAPEAAQELYSRVAERRDLTPSAMAWVLRQRSYAYQQSGEDEAALRDAEEAVRLDPAQPMGLAALSRALESLGQIDAALRRSVEAVALDPDAWRHVQRVGIVAMRSGNLDRATDYLRRACEMSGNQEGCANLAVGLQRAGRDDEALAVARRAESMTSTRWGEYNLACFWSRRGNPKSALAALRQASDLGYADVLIATDPDLDSLRGNDAFEREVARVLDRVRERRGLATTVFPWQG